MMMKLMLLAAVIGLAAAGSCGEDPLNQCDHLTIMGCDFDTNPSHPYKVCFDAVDNARTKEQLLANCRKMVPGSSDYFFFYKSLAQICRQKAVEIDQCCQVCDFSGQLCYDSLHPQIQASITNDCFRAWYAPASPARDQFWLLLDNLNQLCAIKKLPKVEPPCDVCTSADECDFANEEHPTNDCYNAMDATQQAALVASCDSAAGADWAAVAATCLTFNQRAAKPIDNVCPCDKCDLSGEACFIALDAATQASMQTSCCNNLGNNNYGSFILSTLPVCQAALAPGICPCKCDFEQFSCFNVMPPLVQDSIVRTCGPLNPESPEFWSFMDNLASVCSMKLMAPMYSCDEALRPT